MWGTFCGLLVLAPETCHLVTEGGGGLKKERGEVMIFFVVGCET